MKMGLYKTYIKDYKHGLVYFRLLDEPNIVITDAEIAQLIRMAMDGQRAFAFSKGGDLIAEVEYVGQN